MTRLDRRTFVSALAATAALRPPAARAAATIRIGALASQNSGEAFYAQKRDAFAKAGLDVQIQTFQSGAASADAMAGGAIDVGIADVLSVASAHAHGVPIVYIAPASLFTAARPSYVIMVASDSKIQTAKDFSGKTIGVNGVKNILQIPTEAWIDNHGGDSKTVKFVEIPFPAQGPAIIAGRIDAGLLSEPFITNNLATGKLRVISVANGTIAPQFMYSGWATTTTWANANPDAVRKLIAVFADTAAWANTHDAETAAMLVDFAKLEPAVAAKMIRVQYGERLNAALVQPVIDAAAKYGAIPAPFPATDLFSSAARR